MCRKSAIRNNQFLKYKMLNLRVHFKLQEHNGKIMVAAFVLLLKYQRVLRRYHVSRGQSQNIDTFNTDVHSLH